MVQSPSPQRLKRLIDKMSTPSFDSVSTFKFVRDIWKCGAPNITSLELENASNYFLQHLPNEFHRLDHLKFNGTFSESPVAYITQTRFPMLAYLEMHKIEIDASS